ncbi:archaellin/type IV pilin N-terminal domain-containing protein [Halorubrum sp. C191]|uniref:archaellin/type IV pilin N-terminal domain-containing protein n=1 Tax=Halorubrum sp. C191 TaxID=1383842 RepID=UPI001F539468|nr:archaellin/type IV pilin N-terminal domain-containing protein [Halorubrum sp. C191]
MFEFITNPEERGQVGIGTLIVFIAMVLVAAIAAGVLINTAGFLQTQAEATGQESTDLVSERIDVTSEVGVVGSPSPGELSEVRLGVSGAPGADQIDLTETTIQAVGPGGQSNLVFTSSASGPLTQVSVPQLDAGQSSVDVTVNYDNIDAFDADDSGQKLVVEYGGGETTEITGSNFDGQTIIFNGDSSVDNELSASLSQGDTVSVDLKDTNGGSSVLNEKATQTVDPVQLEVGDVSPGSTATVSLTYTNIESMTDSDSSQELLIEYDADDNGDGVDSTTTVTEADFSGGSVDINAVDASSGGDASGNTSIDTQDASTPGSFSADDTLTVTLTDSNGDTVGSTTETVDDTNPAQIIQNSAAEATKIFTDRVGTLGPNEFAIGSDGNFRTSAVLNEERDFTILINPDAGALEDTDNNEAFGESDSATLDIVSPSGATTSVELRAPDLFNKNGEAVRL